MNNTFILREMNDAQRLYIFLRGNWQAMAEAGRPMQIVCSEYRAKRHNSQNALYWTRLGQIAEQAMIAGHRFSAEAFHEHLKRLHLPEKTNSGKAKWEHLPTGERVLAIGTPDLDVGEFATYMDQIEAHAATEWGVAFVTHEYA